MTMADASKLSVCEFAPGEFFLCDFRISVRGALMGSKVSKEGAHFGSNGSLRWSCGECSFIATAVVAGLINAKGNLPFSERDGVAFVVVSEGDIKVEGLSLKNVSEFGGIPSSKKGEGSRPCFFKGK